MDTIDELLEYKVVVIDVQEEVPAKEAVMDEEGNEVEPAQEATTQTVQKRISYNGNGAVGSSATVEYEGEEYTGTIQHEREEPLSFNKHLKVKVNDTAASKAVFGVFVAGTTTQTMTVAFTTICLWVRSVTMSSVWRQGKSLNW